MNCNESAAPDSGYPTPRDELESNSSHSPTPQSSNFPLTSTPLRNQPENKICLRNYFESIKEQSFVEENLSRSTKTETNLDLFTIIKPLIVARQEMKKMKKENESLLNESNRVREENESLKEILQNSICIPDIPQLNLADMDDEKLKEIKKEMASVIENNSFVLNEQKENFISQLKMENTNTVTATALIKVDTEKNDVDVQTESGENYENVNVINTSLKIEVDKLLSKLEMATKEKLDLENRILNCEKLKESHEKTEIIYKNKYEQLDKNTRKQINDLNVRLSTIRNERDKIQEENRKLIEDHNLHEFELDELKVQTENLQEKLKIVNKNAENLKTELEKERSNQKSIEDEQNKMKLVYEEKIKELEQKIDSLLIAETTKKEEIRKKEKEAEEKIKEAEKIKSDNEYLTLAQQSLIETEMNLKQMIIDLETSLRNSQNQAILIKEQLEAEKIARIKAENENDDLKATIQKSDDHKQDINELLEEMEKGKKEIDFLRKEMSRKSEDLKEFKIIKQELEAKNQEIQKLSESIKNVNYKEKDEKIEELIREAASNEKEIENLNKELENNRKIMNENIENSKQSSNIIEELKLYSSALAVEFEEYKKNAESQYYQDVLERNDYINILEKKISEFQSSSVQKKNEETQTIIEQLEKEEKSANSSIGSLISTSSNSNSLDIKFERLVTKLKEYSKINIQTSSYSFSSQTCSNICQNLIELIDSLLTDFTSPVAEASRFWELLTKHLKSVDKKWSKIVEEVKNEKIVIETKLKIKENELESSKTKIKRMTDELNKEMQNYEHVKSILKQNNEDLRQELTKKNEMINNEHECFQELQKEFEHQFQENEHKKHLLEENMKFFNEEKSKWENEAKNLRERLESDQHEIEELKRKQINQNMDQNLLESSTKKLKELEEEKENLKKKRKFDKESMQLLIKANEKKERIIFQLRERNKKRQNLLDYIMKNIGSSNKRSMDPNDFAYIVRNDIQDKYDTIKQSEESDSVDSETFGSNGILVKHQKNQEESSSSKNILACRNVELTQ